MTRTVHTFASCLRIGDTIVATDENQCKILDISGDDSEMAVYFDSIYNGSNISRFRGIDCVRLLMPEPDPEPYDDPSHYARRFRKDESRDWQNNAELNLLFVKCQETYLNDLLHARGHVFLNEAYDALGFSRTAAGALVGWIDTVPGKIIIKHIHDEARTKKAGDLFLDFNVQGVIFDKLPGKWDFRV